LLTTRRHVHVPLLVISLSLAWMFRLRMIWRTLSFAFHSCRFDINDAGLHLTFHDYRLPPHPKSHNSFLTSHHIRLHSTTTHAWTEPDHQTSSPSPSPPITPQQTPLRTPISARPLPRLRRVPRPTRAGPVRPRSMMISVVWRVGRFISVSPGALALARSHLFFAIRYK
jgi:hypothetical protein